MNLDTGSLKSKAAQSFQEQLHTNSARAGSMLTRVPNERIESLLRQMNGGACPLHADIILPGGLVKEDPAFISFSDRLKTLGFKGSIEIQYEKEGWYTATGGSRTDNPAIACSTFLRLLPPGYTGLPKKKYDVILIPCLDLVRHPIPAPVRLRDHIRAVFRPGTGEVVGETATRQELRGQDAASLLAQVPDRKIEDCLVTMMRDNLSYTEIILRGALTEEDPVYKAFMKKLKDSGFEGPVKMFYETGGGYSATGGSHTDNPAIACSTFIQLLPPGSSAAVDIPYDRKAPRIDYFRNPPLPRRQGILSALGLRF